MKTHIIVIEVSTLRRGKFCLVVGSVQTTNGLVYGIGGGVRPGQLPVAQLVVVCVISPSGPQPYQILLMVCATASNVWLKTIPLPSIAPA